MYIYICIYICIYVYIWVIPELRDIKMVDNFDFFFVKYFGFHVFFLLSRP